MRLGKSVLSLRSKSHVNTRLQIRDERAYATRLIPWLALVNISFAAVDSMICRGTSPLTFLAIRLIAVGASWLLFQSSRGRVRHGTRLLFTVGPYIWGVQYVMLSEHLSFSPYLAGLALVMVTSTMLFPVKTRIAAETYLKSVLPIIVWAIFFSDGPWLDRANLLLMTLGSVFVCSVNSGQVYQDIRERLKVSETLARDLGKREAEVRRKAEQLLKRRTFESQFSPQVVNAVLNDPNWTSGRSQCQLVIIVLDIENSTGKATTLEGTRYDEVVEEVYDVFASACLQWNITVDKFTGDGGMSFAGAPVQSDDDFRRSLMACRDTIRMLQARKSKLDQLWGESLNIRMAMVEGKARAGFIGRGTLKAYTAVGEVVSFTHRLASVPPAWSIAAYSWSDPSKLEQNYLGLSTEVETAKGLKGFGGKEFSIRIFRSQHDTSAAIDAGRCGTCETPLVFEEDAFGMPKVVCPGCRSRASAIAA
jgi:class 3 adenylate cyclase